MQARDPPWAAYLSVPAWQFAAFVGAQEPHDPEAAAAAAAAAEVGAAREAATTAARATAAATRQSPEAHPHRLVKEAAAAIAKAALS